MPTDPRDARIAEIRRSLDNYTSCGPLDTRYDDVWIAVRDLLTAEAEARETIARLTSERANDIQVWERRIDDAWAERDAYRRNASLAERTRTEQAEATIARLEQERDEAEKKAQQEVMFWERKSHWEIFDQRAADLAAARAQLAQAAASRASLHAALRELEEKWRSEAAPHLGATGDEAEIAYAKVVCADELAALLPSPQEQT